MTNFYISHGGPGSGRYPLGSGERPYQKFEGKGRKSSGGIRGYIRSRKEKRAEEEAQKARNQELRKRMEEVQDSRGREAEKERVLREGTATEVMRFQGELSNQELQNAFTRLNLESQIRRMSAQETKTAMDKIDRIMKNVKTGTEWTKIGIDAYNTMVSIYNTTEQGMKNPMPSVKKGDGGKKKEDS